MGKKRRLSLDTALEYDTVYLKSHPRAAGLNTGFALLACCKIIGEHERELLP
jgi:hypothetical protein